MRVFGGKVMKDTLIPIGMMAEMNHTTIATLRLYDQLGLLKPKYVDEETKYRYYDVQQNARLDMIAYMKELGMSLQEIQKVLESQDIEIIESILAKKNEQIHQEMNDLKLKHDAIERSISSIEHYRTAPTPGVPILQYMDRRYIWKMKCTENFYLGNIMDYEKSLAELRSRLMENGFSYIHTYNVGTSISYENISTMRLVPDNIFVFVQSQSYKSRNDVDIVDSGMYACIYANDYDSELPSIKKLLYFCKENNYEICGDYICEVLTEFNVFDTNQRSMFMRLQVPVKFR